MSKREDPEWRPLEKSLVSGCDVPGMLSKQPHAELAAKLELPVPDRQGRDLVEMAGSGTRLPGSHARLLTASATSVSQATAS